MRPWKLKFFRLQDEVSRSKANNPTQKLGHLSDFSSPACFVLIITNWPSTDCDFANSSFFFNHSLMIGILELKICIKCWYKHIN